MPTAAELLGLLAEPDRLRVVAALALGARTPAEVGERAGLGAPTVGRAIARLRAAGLVVDGEDGALELRAELFKEAARAAASAAEPDDALPAGAAGAVLRAFLRDGRLVSIPSARGKRLVVLDHLARAFEPGVRYPEPAVNAMLRAFHPDHAALRRYLVDEGFLAREGGVYWRIGGTVEV